MAPVQKLNDFKLMLFVLFFTLTIIIYMYAFQ